jgi:iron complex outermembrane recepter protein
MQSQASANTLKALSRIAGSDYPSQFLVYDTGFVLGTLDALAQNKASPVVPQSTYSNTETANAFFVQTDLETEVLGRTLRANAGVRHVETKVVSDTVQRNTAGVWVPITTNAKYTDTMPSVSFAYDLMNKLVWRGSWGKTLTPNRVSDIAQALRLPNNALYAVTVANPALEPERATGSDTTLEWYADKSSVVSLGYFQRKITGEGLNLTSRVPFSSLGIDRALWQPFQQGELLADPNKLIDVTIKVNNPAAYQIKGFELLYSQAFKFLPAPFDGLGGTFSFTKVDVDGFVKTIAGQTVSLPRLPPKGYAATIYYEKGPFSTRVSFNHKDAFANTGSNDMNGVGFQRWFNARNYTDLTVGYKVLKNLEVRMDVINLTKTKTYEYFKNYDPAKQAIYGDDTSRIENGFQAGRTIQLTLRGSF